LEKGWVVQRVGASKGGFKNYHHQIKEFWGFQIRIFKGNLKEEDLRRTNFRG